MRSALANKLETVREVAARHGVRSLAAFGSVLRDDFDPIRSDIDLIVDFGGADLGPWMRRYFELQRELESVLGFHVDLMLEGSQLNPFVRATVERGRSSLYVAA